MFIYKTGQEQEAYPVVLANTFMTRFAGLMLTSPRRQSGLMLFPCRGVHTLFMRYPLDIFFLDKDWKIVALNRNLKPWRASKVYRHAVATLEFPSALGWGKDWAIGDELTIDKE